MDISINNNYKSNFTGQVIVLKNSYNIPKLKEIAKELRPMKIVRNLDANIYLSQPFNKTKIYIQKDKLASSLMVQPIETTYTNKETVIAAAKRAIDTYKKIESAKAYTTKQNNSIFYKLKNTMNKLSQKFVKFIQNNKK